MDKLRVAILTLYYKNYNYGGQLQAYALCEKISDFGCNCKQISFKRNRKKLIGRKIRALLKSPFHDNLELVILHLNAKFPKTKEQKLIIRNNIQKFDEFIDSIPHTEVVDSETIHHLNEKYDCFVVGSDQVWNPEFVPMDFFFDFVEENKMKMSYAASIRIPSFEKKEGQLISRLINRFDYISVREDKSKEILRKIGVEKDICVDLDPTMLLEKNEWEKIAKTPDIAEKYIVTYLVRDRRSIKQLRKFAELNHYKIVAITQPGYVNKSDDIYININEGIGPREFIGLIKNAEIVFPNSFHGTVFSIIFNKQFFVYGDLATDQRKKTLLNKFGLTHRLIPYDCDLEKLSFDEIQYDEINAILAQERQETINVIRNVLLNNMER